MKIEGPSSIKRTSGRANVRGAVGGFSLPSFETSNVSSMSSTNASASLSGLDALLALQAFPDTLEERKRRATNRANDLLDQLEDLKIATLTGEVNIGQLVRLRSALSQARDEIEDSGLKGILDEIEQRAEVELAKLERSI